MGRCECWTDKPCPPTGCGQYPQTASAASRRIVNPDGTIGLEDGLKASIGEALEAIGHKIASAEAVNFLFGGAQLIWRMNDDGDLSYCAVSDHRKDGGGGGVLDFSVTALIYRKDVALTSSVGRLK